MDTTLPIGFTFNPTDRELIWHYLFKKANGRPLPPSPIIDCDIYGDVSSWRNIFEDRDEDSLYFFNTFSSPMVARATEFGTSKCQSDTKIYAEELLLGSKRDFLCMENKKEEGPKKNASMKTGWTMQEYRLDGFLLQHSSNCRYVISKITRPTHMRRDVGQYISSQIERELQARINVDQMQDNEKI